jgi:alkanesulfonate monooxygenase SsuD/methylene tetrahydromethanopterin reductase-like flavin-dependent oxidoreductase (luciferase family)
MKGKDKLLKALKLGELTPKRMARIRRLRASAATRRPRTTFPDMGMNVRLIIRETSATDAEAFQSIAMALTQKCGGRETGSQQHKSVLSKADIATIRAREEEILDFIADSPENAALFVYDPVAALQRMEKPFDGRLLAKLRALSEAAGTRAPAMPRLNISSLTVEVEKKTIRKPGKDFPKTNKSTEESPPDN